MSAEALIEEGVAHFRIDGEYITRLARDGFAYEDNMGWAYSLLKDGLCGIEHEQVIEILLGTKKLVGVNNVELVDDKPSKKYAARVALLTAGVLKHKGVLYRPSRTQVLWTEEDMLYAARKFGGSQNRRGRGADEFQKERARYWAETNETLVTMADLSIEQLRGEYPPGRRAVTWIPAGELVVGTYVTHLDPEKALASFVAAGGKLGVFPRHEDLPPPAPRKTKAERAAEKAASEASTKAEREARIARETAESERVEREFQERVERWRKQIVFMCDNMKDGWLELSDERVPGVVLRVPRVPYTRWCVWRDIGWQKADEILPWFNVCPSSVKMAMDDSNHTDALVGAGIPLDEAYDHECDSYRIFWGNRHETAEAITQNAYTLLAGKPATGTYRVVTSIDQLKEWAHIEKPLAVVATAGPENDLFLRRVTALGGTMATETGGKLCHLAIVSREQGGSLIMLPNALQRLALGEKWKLYCEDGLQKIALARTL